MLLTAISTKRGNLEVVCTSQKEGFADRYNCSNFIQISRLVFIFTGAEKKNT
jgi:hypothetical protein